MPAAAAVSTAPSLGGRVPGEGERARVSREAHKDGGVMGDPLAR